MTIPTQLIRGQAFILQTNQDADEAWLHGPYVAQKDVSAQELADGFAAWLARKDDLAVSEAADIRSRDGSSVIWGNYDGEDRHNAAFVHWLETEGLVTRIPCEIVVVHSADCPGIGVKTNVDGAESVVQRPHRFPGLR